jgi:hypothetical protein
MHVVVVVLDGFSGLGEFSSLHHHRLLHALDDRTRHEQLAMFPPRLTVYDLARVNSLAASDDEHARLIDEQFLKCVAVERKHLLADFRNG